MSSSAPVAAAEMSVAQGCDFYPPISSDLACILRHRTSHPDRQFLRHGRVESKQLINL